MNEMKISEYIKELEDTMEDFGDVEIKHYDEFHGIVSCQNIIAHCKDGEVWGKIRGEGIDAIDHVRVN